MDNITLNQETLVNYSGMSAELIANTIERFGDWDTFVEQHKNVCRNGIDTGISGWIMTHELVQFYADNKADILSFASEMAKEIGDSGTCSMVETFVCLRGQYSIDEVAEALYDIDSENHDTIAEAMAWFVAEEVTRSYERMVEDAESEED